MTSQPLGGPLPPALDGYYADLDAGRLVEAGKHFTDDVLYALPPAGEIETNPRVEHVGRDAVLAWFDQRGRKPHVHDVQLCVAVGRDCVLEGVTRDDAGQVLSTFVEVCSWRTRDASAAT